MSRIYMSSVDNHFPQGSLFKFQTRDEVCFGLTLRQVDKLPKAVVNHLRKIPVKKDGIIKIHHVSSYLFSEVFIRLLKNESHFDDHFICLLKESEKLPEGVVKITTQDGFEFRINRKFLIEREENGLRSRLLTSSFKESQETEVKIANVSGIIFEQIFIEIIGGEVSLDDFAWALLPPSDHYCMGNLVKKIVAFYTDKLLEMTEYDVTHAARVLAQDRQYSQVELDISTLILKAHLVKVQRNRAQLDKFVLSMVGQNFPFFINSLTYTDQTKVISSLLRLFLYKRLAPIRMHVFLKAFFSGQDLNLSVDKLDLNKRTLFCLYAFLENYLVLNTLTQPYEKNREDIVSLGEVKDLIHFNNIQSRHRRLMELERDNKTPIKSIHTRFLQMIEEETYQRFFSESLKSNTFKEIEHLTEEDKPRDH